MVQIKMQQKDGTSKEYPACKILAEINDTEDIATLIAMKWGSTGKKDFLTGKQSSMCCIIAEPLTEKEADLAMIEYKLLLNSN